MSTATDRLERGRARWRQIVDERPDLEPAVRLQQRLLARQIEILESLGRDVPPYGRLPSGYVIAKLGRGVPAMAGEPIEIPASLLAPLLPAFARELAAGGAGEAARHIAEALEQGRIDAGSLLAASLGRDEGAVRTFSVHAGLAPDLLWLLAELAVAPFAYCLHRTIASGDEDGSADGAETRAAIAAWDRGYCPICGSWPALAQIVSARAVLTCSFCAATWQLARHRCIYCDEDDEAFAAAAPDIDRPDRRLELCRACGGYLKTVALASETPFPLVAIEDLASMDLDVAAMKLGFGRPPLRLGGC